MPTADVMSTQTTSRDRGLWTVPNLISFIRLACLPVFLYLVFPADDDAGAALLLAVLGMTDWVDGYVARHFDQVSEIGKVLDPVADRLLFFVGLSAMLIAGAIPTFVGFAILAREVVVGGTTVVLAALGARRIDVTWFGKAGTFCNMVAMPAFLGSHSTLRLAGALGWVGWIAVVPGLILSYVAAFMYIPIARRALAEGREARKHALAGPKGAST